MQFPHGLTKAAVLAPLRATRDHAVRDLVAWIIAVGAVAAVVAAFGDAVGWPEPEHRVEGHLIDVEVTEDGAVVTYEAGAGGRVVRWAERMDDDHDWEVGETAAGWIVDGSFHRDVGLSFEGPAGSLFVVLSAVFVGWALRPLLAIAIALADVRRSRYHPHRGYVALVHHPNPKAMRDVLVVWRDDPTTGSPVRRGDDHLLVQDERAAGISSKVWEAWIDRGRFRWTKPRWVVVCDRVFVPHRRALLRPWRRWLQWVSAVQPVPLEPTSPAPTERSKHRPFVTMFLWRLAASTCFAIFSVLLLEPGAPVRPQ